MTQRRPHVQALSSLQTRRRRWLALSALVIAGVWFSAQALAQVPAIYQGADLKLGEQLIEQNKCSQCHATKVGGDGSAIYKPMGRINNAGLLRGMVEQCNSMLNLQMFPEEVTAVAAVLNRDHYQFK
ncbi:MAG: hypothetical protein RL297_2187 [Pseudomonadota bacterium]|jgi:hypothetical protein